MRELPSGVPCQFRVRAYNSGGWGELSEATLMVCPGEDQTPMETMRKWKKLKQGGPLMIIDRLQEYPKHRLDQLKG